MSIYHSHNLVTPLATDKPFGIKVKVRSTDPFRNLVGGEWHREHWFSTEAEREAALAQMSSEYVYFRPGDRPTLDYEKISR